MAGGQALEGKRGTFFWLRPEDFVLVTDPEDPLYDPRVSLPLKEEFVASVAYYGVIHEVIVTKRDGKPVVVAGRQRVRAALEANKLLKAQGKELIKVPCRLREGEAGDLFGVSVAENEQRHATSYVERAKKMARMLSFGKRPEEVGIAFGMTATAVSKTVGLLELSVPVLKAVDEGKVSQAAALELRGLSAAQQRDALAELLEKVPGRNGKRTSRQAAEVAGRAGKKAKMRGRSEIEERLKEKRLPSDYRAALLWVLREDEAVVVG